MHTMAFQARKIVLSATLKDDILSMATLGLVSLCFGDATEIA